MYTATISRLLTAAFGLVALANLVVFFTQFFARMGIASALVQKPELSEEDIRAASTAGVAVVGACLAAVWSADSGDHCTVQGRPFPQSYGP